MTYLDGGECCIDEKFIAPFTFPFEIGMKAISLIPNSARVYVTGKPMS